MFQLVQYIPSFKKNQVPVTGDSDLGKDISRLTTHEKSIVDRHRFRLYSVKAGYVRQTGLDCKHDPIEENEAHALITGSFSNSNCRKLAKGAVRIPYPD